MGKRKRTTRSGRGANGDTKSPTVSSSRSGAQEKAFACTESGCTQVCGSVGGLDRHLQSLAHQKLSSPSLRGCEKALTRIDAQKRRHRLVKCTPAAGAAGELEDNV